MRRSALIFLLFSLHVFAESLPTCVKQKPTDPFSGQIPTNFVLIPACKDALPAKELVSTYLFLGDATVSGIIRYEDSAIFDSYSSFTVDSGSEALIPTIAGSFRLDGSSPNAQKAFNLPKLTPEVTCWEAPAKIRIKYINIEEDGGTDAAGNFLIDYSVISVGKYQPCNTQDS